MTRPAPRDALGHVVSTRSTRGGEGKATRSQAQRRVRFTSGTVGPLRRSSGHARDVGISRGVLHPGHHNARPRLHQRHDAVPSRAESSSPATRTSDTPSPMTTVRHLSSKDSTRLAIVPRRVHPGESWGDGSGPSTHPERTPRADAPAEMSPALRRRGLRFPSRGRGGRSRALAPLGRPGA